MGAPRVAVTRPALHADGTVAALIARGYEPVRTPLLTVEPMGDAGAVDAATVLAFTSRTAPRLLAHRNDLKALQVVAVGRATAQEASDAGFVRVREASGDVAGLRAALVAEGPSRVLHLSGEEQSGNLVEDLTVAGIPAERQVIYRMVPQTALPDPASEACLLFSPRTADVFAALSAGNAWQTVPCAVISERAAAPLHGRRVVVAARPTEAALLDALDTLGLR